MHIIFSANMHSPMNHHITLSPSGHEFQCPEGVELLKAGLAAGFRIPFSCRSGMCRSCRGRVVQGTVDFGAAHVKYLSDAERANGLALLCCAMPTSDVVIEIDEIDPHKHLKPQRIPSRVLSFKEVAPDVRVITLGLPANEPMQFRAGQFVDVFLPDGARRSYSIANMPKAEGVRQLELHIRHMPGGRFTDHVFQSLKLREIWQIEMPLGSFCINEAAHKPLIFLASGTGFAPIKSMLHIELEKPPAQPIHLYWGGRQKADLYDMELATQWAIQYPHFKFVPVLSEAKAQDSWGGRTGYVHLAVLQDHPNLCAHEVYACGAPAMVDAARSDFAKLAELPADAFFADAFLSEADRAQTASTAPI